MTWRTGLERKVIEAGGNAEPVVDAGIIRCRHPRNPVRLQKGDELVAPDVEEDVSKIPALLDVYHIGDDCLEAQDALVKLAGLIQVKRRQANVRKSFVSHGCHSLR